jgi:hypothetical protein
MSVRNVNKGGRGMIILISNEFDGINEGNRSRCAN